MVELVKYIVMNHWPVLVGLATSGVFARMTNRWFGWLAWLVAGFAVWLFLFWTLRWEMPKELFGIVGTISVAGLVLFDLAHGVGTSLRNPRNVMRIVSIVALAGAVLFLAHNPVIRDQIFMIAGMLIGLGVMFRIFFPRRGGGR